MRKFVFQQFNRCFANSSDYTSTKTSLFHTDYYETDLSILEQQFTILANSKMRTKHLLLCSCAHGKFLTNERKSLVVFKSIIDS